VVFYVNLRIVSLLFPTVLITRKILTNPRQPSSAYPCQLNE
jgi:hypothetical protein